MLVAGEREVGGAGDASQARPERASQYFIHKQIPPMPRERQPSAPSLGGFQVYGLMRWVTTDDH